jgi:hypothetical protein
MKRRLAIALLAAMFMYGEGFLVSYIGSSRRKQTSPLALTGNDNSNSNNSWLPSPFQGITDILKNMDDVIDDFMCKRMGNGEVFYGKRKYNPSGKVDGVYNGMGMSDKTKIDITREYKEMVMEERRRRQMAAEESRD